MKEKMTVKEVREWLETAEGGEELFCALKADSRAGVKKLIASWERRREKAEKMRSSHLGKEAFDAGFRSDPLDRVAGVDEAGRGPLAGPVVTAAVILPPHAPTLVGLDDSKALTRSERERLAELIRETAVAWSVHVQPAAEIDRLNIYQATKRSMEEAVRALDVRPESVIADAMNLDAGIPCSSVVKADAKSLAVAAASVLAKTERDRYMDRLHERHPVYNFKRNAGYPTPEHLRALEQHGPCPEHRTSFAPVAGCAAQTVGIRS
ncbi:ribonuclease HII [Edaphobacillus lindanitolerans]|uniref:Ribonuclease HII n=1 Tax=Edaphobacillus lindanitolerans TaxID=550447 RepID=A0A1U7PHF7_9BACI|nr:ribonuclease HII [Edaphobacillus lindanitolerans]SIT67421.1 RNase HII [Edaphobacillus lindanitolerans]